jgi:two-component system KDP operon response regulator KdpE
MRLLIVEDEKKVARFIRQGLVEEGYAVDMAADGEEGLAAALGRVHDLIILDINLPKMDGRRVLQELRRQKVMVPVLLLTVRATIEDKVLGLDAGADDYLTKPFGAGELMARIRVALRRSAQPDSQIVFTSDDLTVDLSSRKVSVDGREISLTPTEYDILRALVQHAGKVLTHSQLLRTVWGIAYEDENHLLRVNVSNLRRKVEKDPARPKHVITEPGVGYRLKMA